MNGDLIIKDVDLEQLEEDLDYLLEEFFEAFENGESPYTFNTDAAGARVLGMLKTWAESRRAEREAEESRRAEKEDEELAESLTKEQFPDATRNAAKLLKQGVLAGLKEQRKRLGK